MNPPSFNLQPAGGPEGPLEQSDRPAGAALHLFASIALLLW
jgi:hypothetical protein